MATIKVHGSVFSTPTIRVFATLYEKDIEFEFVPIDMGAGEHKKEPFISLNPFGQIPAFEDGDLKLFGYHKPIKDIRVEKKSRAITQYLAHEYADKGTPLVIRDSKKMAIISLWSEVEGQKFDPVASKLAFELAIKPLFKMTTDAAVVEENEAKLAAVLDVYETRLAQSKYLAGESFTLADLHHLPTIHYLMGTQSKKLFESRPHVSAWVADITARPAWNKVIALRNKY